MARLPLRRRVAEPEAGARVSLLLPSGRSLTAALRRRDEQGALVLELPAVAALPTGSAVELRWEERAGWASLAGVVAGARPPGHRDAGLLRVTPTAAPEPHRERRRTPRRPAALRLDVRVLRAGAVMPGTELATWVEDATAAAVAFDAELALQPGDELRLELRGDSGESLGRVDGRVARVERPPGALHQRVGVVLLEPPQDLLAALRRGEA